MSDIDRCCLQAYLEYWGLAGQFLWTRVCIAGLYMLLFKHIFLGVCQVVLAINVLNNFHLQCTSL
jgi:hypothetical protein